MDLSVNSKLKIALLLCLSALVFSEALEVYGSTKNMPQSSTKKLNDIEMRNWMVQISKELGITCAECHNTKNFKDGSSQNFKVALNHMMILKQINDGFKKDWRRPEASCFMCHQGKLRPEYKAPKNLTD